MTRLLLIDRHADLRLFHRVLFEVEGYNVIDVGTADAARTVLAHGQPDAIVLDPQLTNENGLLFLREIKLANPEVPIIINTATDFLRHYCLDLGTAAFVLKSQGFPTLQRVVSNILHRQPRLERKVQFGSDIGDSRQQDMYRKTGTADRVRFDERKHLHP